MADVNITTTFELLLLPYIHNYHSIGSLTLSKVRQEEEKKKTHVKITTNDEKETVMSSLLSMNR